MIRVVSKLLQNYEILYPKSCYLGHVQMQKLLYSTSEDKHQQSLTASYLINSCGLSPEKAISASKYVNIGSVEKPNSVLEFLRAHGFTKSHISRLISQHPFLILANPEKTLKPKIEFFESIGFGEADLCRIIRARSKILLHSLENRIIPNVDLLRKYVVTNHNLIRALKVYPDVVVCNVQKKLMPNISTLCAHGVPEVNIGRLIMLHPISLVYGVDQFKEVVNEVHKMGFSPLSRSYILAVRSMITLSRSGWRRKKELLMNYGWSETEFQNAFIVQASFMRTSEKKIMELMNFYTNKVGLKPSDVARCPNLFLVSLKKRIIPRCSVIDVLMTKGLIKEKIINLTTVLSMSKKLFDEKFVNQVKFPEVVTAYQQEIGFQGFSNPDKIHNFIKTASQR